MEPAGPARVERRLGCDPRGRCRRYSRLIEADEERTLGRLRALRDELGEPVRETACGYNVSQITISRLPP
jgi:hypothetical protein